MRNFTQLTGLRVSGPFFQASTRPIYPLHIKHANGQVSIQSYPRHTTRSFSSQTNDSETNITFQPGKRLSGRKCLITGGTSGIGFAIAERFLQEGASTIVLVGRSQMRLEEAASRLAPFTIESPTVDESNGEVATRAPEEDMQQSTQGNIRLLVGDVSDTGSWMRELEKEMVSYPVYIKDSKPNIILGKCRHPGQRSRNLDLKHPTKIRAGRYFNDSTHKSRRCNADFESINASLDP